MADVIFPRDTTRDIDNTKVAKPEYLYAYKDPNAGTPLYGWTQAGETLYAWTTESEDSTPTTFYTKTENPTTDTVLYDAEGNILTFADILYLDIYNFSTFYSATSEAITLKGNTSG